MRILITGVAGMIGSHLLDLLLKDPNNLIYGVDNLKVGKIDNISNYLGNKNFIYNTFDVTNIYNFIDLYNKLDVIIHLAAEKKGNELMPSFNTLIVNTKGTENMLELAKQNRCKFIFASTSDVYGLSEKLPFNEDDNIVLGPSLIKRWSYAVSKLYCEQLSFAYYKDFNVPIVILRYFGGFSEKASFTWSCGHIPLFIDSVINDTEVNVHGDGKQTRSMCYIKDIVDGTASAIKSEKAIGEIINVGSDEEISVIDSVYIIRDVFYELTGIKREVKIKHIPMHEIFGQYKDILRRRPDLNKAKKLLSYTPQYTFKEGVRITMLERLSHKGSI
ncbi:MAG: Nucleoside-diphosphate-sugar epimerase (UDP-glucose 4-epimerase) [uncultured bacterium]|nr:MAG: Nucleoside-diphosphate-sugar epimerase (UDP-glucose 4-epimerase) [uncultured bacterium]